MRNTNTKVILATESGYRKVTCSLLQQQIFCTTTDAVRYRTAHNAKLQIVCCTYAHTYSCHQHMQCYVFTVLL